MDSPQSWAVLTILCILLLVWFVIKANAEQEQNRRENDDFFLRHDKRG